MSYNINNTLNFDLKQLKFDRNILEKCENFCGYNNDCYKEYFHYIEEREATYATNHMDIHVIPTTLPNTIITHLPKMGLQEFLCFIACIFSLWYGFSIMMLSDFCLILFNKVNQLILKFKQINVKVFYIKTTIKLRNYKIFRVK